MHCDHSCSAVCFIFWSFPMRFHFRQKALFSLKKKKKDWELLPSLNFIDRKLKPRQGRWYVQVHIAGTSQSLDFLLDVGYTTQSCYGLPFKPPAQDPRGRLVTCILNSGAALPWSRSWADPIPCVQIAKEKARLEMHLPCILHTLMLSLTKLLAECRCPGLLQQEEDIESGE